MPYQMPGGDTIAGGGERRGHYALAPAYSPKYENDGLIASTQGRFYVRFQTPEAARRFYEAASEEARPYVSAMIQDQNPLGYVDVFIQSAGLSHTARQSVAEGVSDAFGFYTSGDHPASLSLSMSLLNTRQDQWFDAWALVREALTRPWQLARGNAKLYLQMDTRLYDILPVNESFTYAASQETTVPFSLQALVLGMQVLPMRQAYKHVPTRAQAPPRARSAARGSRTGARPEFRPRRGGAARPRHAAEPRGRAGQPACAGPAAGPATRGDVAGIDGAPDLDPRWADICAAVLDGTVPRAFERVSDQQWLYGVPASGVPWCAVPYDDPRAQVAVYCPTYADKTAAGKDDWPAVPGWQMIYASCVRAHTFVCQACANSTDFAPCPECLDEAVVHVPAIMFAVYLPTQEITWTTPRWRSGTKSSATPT